LCPIQSNKAICRRLLSAPYFQSLLNLKDTWSQSFQWCGVFLQEPLIDNFQRGGTTLSETVLLAFQCFAYFSVASLAGSPGLSPSTYLTAISVHFTFLTFRLSSATLTITTHPQGEETRVYDAIDAEDNHPHKQSQKLNSIF
jgi:hypothetical protein